MKVMVEKKWEEEVVEKEKMRKEEVKEFVEKLKKDKEKERKFLFKECNCCRIILVYVLV